MEIKNVKGGYDFLPKEQKIRNFINDTLRKTFEEFGYNPIETPILCYYDILADKYDEGNDILKEIYKLKDQGDRELGLRYDLTVPFAKFIAINKNSISLPFKRYEINKVFRDGPVKAGRDREFTQCDVDVAGVSGQLIEAELLALYDMAFKRLGIDIVMKYNSRNIMTGIILECGVSEDLVSPVTTVIDKLNKVSIDEFRQMLIEVGLESAMIDKLIENFNYSLKDLNEKYGDNTNPKVVAGLEELNNLSKYLEELNLSDKCVFDITLARGQNYYTGNVFEVYEKNGKISSSIGGGGRYDNMVTEFINDGNSYPTVGISFGLSPIYEILKDRESFENRSNIDLYVIPMGTEIESLKLANQLRELGCNVELEMQSRKLRKSLDYANREKIPYVIILGETEIQEKQFKLKNMFDSSETVFKYDEIEKLVNAIKGE